MSQKNHKRYSETDNLSASEIGQYVYCSVSWYLQKKGYKPISKLLEIGKDKHEIIGKKMNISQIYAKKSRIYYTMGVILILLSILLFLYEVIK